MPEQGDLFLDTLDEARDVFWGKVDEGSTCACCNRFGKRYKRSINVSMSLALTWFYKQYGVGVWFDLEEAIRKLLQARPAYKRPGDFPKFRHWGIVERAPKENPSSRGHYRITPNGELFVTGKLSVPEYVREYNKCPEGFVGRQVTIRETFTNRFDYDELMSL